MELALEALPDAQRRRYGELLAAAESAPVSELDGICDELQARARSAFEGERG
jgi:hypothetical protein